MSQSSEKAAERAELKIDSMKYFLSARKVKDLLPDLEEMIIAIQVAERAKQKELRDLIKANFSVLNGGLAMPGSEMSKIYDALVKAEGEQ